RRSPSVCTSARRPSRATSRASCASSAFATACRRSCSPTRAGSPARRRRAEPRPAAPTLQLAPRPALLARRRGGRTARLAGRLAPAARLAAVGAARERERRAQEDEQIDPRRAMVDVPQVELDPLGPGKPGAAVDLRPARQPRTHLQPAPLALRVALDLVGERRPRPDDAHLAA